MNKAFKNICLKYCEVKIILREQYKKEVLECIHPLKIRDAGVCSMRGSMDPRGSGLSLALCWCRESIGHTCCLSELSPHHQLSLPTKSLCCSTWLFQVWCRYVLSPTHCGYASSFLFSIFAVGSILSVCPSFLISFGLLVLVMLFIVFST